MSLGPESGVPFAVLASGRGSNFEAIARAVREGRLSGRIVAVLSDKADAPVLEKARAAGVPVLAVPAPPREHGTPEERRRRHEEKILEALAPYSPRFLVFAGYMRIITPRLIDAFRDSGAAYSRIVNIHPSLLPAFAGVDGYGQAFRYGAKVAGVTVHLVDREMDGGPVCAQEAFEIGDCADRAEVEKRGLEVEHRLYPEVLEWVLSERFRVSEREGRFCVSQG